jgi:hydrogenase maturation protein HypF
MRRRIKKLETVSAGTFHPLAQTHPLSRLRVTIRGAVQGVGFRPFVYRLAAELALQGWVNNSSQGVCIEVEGQRAALEEFLIRLETEKPPLASLQSIVPVFLDAVGHDRFEIRPSEATSEKTALVLPDIATCRECLHEIFDPANRRYRYPFTNCTNCGPRFSIIEALPYDRANTTMKSFAMCARCRAEYDDPRNRRFHAQPNACPDCGPHLELWDADGRRLESGDGALRAAADAIRRAMIVAVKGLGGFHLIVAAHDEQVVRRLRERKHREAKPLALMFPSLKSVRECCEVSPLEARLLCSPEAPIVLLRRKSPTDEKRQQMEKSNSKSAGAFHPLAHCVAPGNPYLGVMLPYTPLHHLLMAELGFPIVATSGNLTDEPICTDEREGLERLAGIAELFLVHNRPIARHVDDSVARVLLGREQVLRRARGYAPLPLAMPRPVPPALAVGAHLKNSVAISAGNNVFVSQHIGDLETAPAFGAFGRVIMDFQNLYEVQPGVVASDMHPDYLSTRFARKLNLPLTAVQHHYAHVLACMADNELNGPALGVAWDGTGYGTDGTIWGGEFLRVNESGFERVAHLRPFRLPGGEAAIREPRRAAVGLIYEITGQADGVLGQMLRNGVNSPVTSSAGRLFDAVAAILGIRQRSQFEGQAAMELEWMIESGIEESYPPGVDWQPMIEALLEDDAPPGVKAAKFHNALVETIVQVAKQVGEATVVLTGGCFQNRYLTERAVLRLQAEGFRPYWHQRVPPNDGGIALGQLIAVLRQKR